MTRGYNFLFSIWVANQTGKANLFFRFYVWRNGKEVLLFKSSSSGYFSSNTLIEMLWQRRISERTIEAKQGDRLIIRCFINVTVAGTFNIGYDCTQYPSYVNDPTETRYMRSDTQTINGLTAYKLLTSQSSSYASVALDNNGEEGDEYWTHYLGIRVFARHNDSSESEITSGTAVAIVSGDTSGLRSATWSCPSQNILDTDAIEIKVYYYTYSPPTIYVTTFITEVLNASALNSGTWTVYYYLYRSYVSLTFTTYYYFRFGSSTYNSRIENFVWTESVSRSELNYHPTSRTLIGSTTDVSGSLSDLESDNSGYMIFRSYATATAAQDLYAHIETTTINGVNYYLLKTISADVAGTSLSASTTTTGRKLWGKFVYPLAGMASKISASTWTFYYRAWKTTGSTCHADVDILIRKADGTVRTTITTDDAASSGLTTLPATYSHTYSWLDYNVVDQTDYLEWDYYCHVTIAGGSNAFIDIDDNALGTSSQTRTTNIILPSQFTAEVEFSGSSDTDTWIALVWTIDCSSTTASVTGTFKLWNYTLGNYPSSGKGYASATIGTSDVTTSQTTLKTTLVNPTDFRDASGNWKTRMQGVKSTSTCFDLKVDWIRYKRIEAIITEQNYYVDLNFDPSIAFSFVSKTGFRCAFTFSPSVSFLNTPRTNFSLSFIFDPILSFLSDRRTSFRVDLTFAPVIQFSLDLYKGLHYYVDFLFSPHFNFNLETRIPPIVQHFPFIWILTAIGLFSLAFVLFTENLKKGTT